MLIFKDKALERYYYDGNTRNLSAQQHLPRLNLALQHLKMVRSREDLNLRVLGLHQLTGDRAGQYAMKLSRNWRLVFRYEAETNTVYDIEIEDYH